MYQKLLKILFCFCLLATNLSSLQSKDIVVVFDFGGVVAQADTVQMKSFLMDSFSISKEELSKAFRAMQSHVSTGGSEKQFWEQYAVAREITLPKDWFDQYRVVIRQSIHEIPGTLAIIRKLQCQGYRTAMLSDVTEYQAKIIREIGYYDLFNPVLLSYKIGVNKPRPEAFQILLQTLQSPASQVIFIDDRIENVEGAKKLGIDAIQFLDPRQLQQELEQRGIVAG